jgi:hypothetical protein
MAAQAEYARVRIARIQAALIGAGCAAAFESGRLAEVWWSLAHRDPPAFLSYVAFTLFTGAMGASLSGISLILFERWRQLGNRLLIGSVVFWALLFGIRQADLVRVVQFPVLQGVVQRAAPLVAAIRAYDAQHHNPPPDLRDLVPEFLSAIPETGLDYSPSFKYLTMFDRGPHGKQLLEDERWSLWAWVMRPGDSLGPNGKLLYNPSGIYRERNDGRPVMRVGDWKCYL